MWRNTVKWKVVKEIREIQAIHEMQNKIPRLSRGIFCSVELALDRCALTVDCWSLFFSIPQ